VYWAGPIAGALIGVLLTRVHPLQRLQIDAAKIYHFEHDPHGLLR
jgi:hypothetical protein